MRNDVERWCQLGNTWAASRGPGTWSRAERQYNVRVPFERIVINTVGYFLLSQSGNQYLLITMDSTTKWPEVYATSDPSMVADILVPTSFAVSRS
jgi:hypothetical protein